MLKMLLQGMGLEAQTIELLTSLSSSERKALLQKATTIATKIAEALEQGGEVYIRKPDGTMTKLEI